MTCHTRGARRRWTTVGVVFWRIRGGGDAGSAGGAAGAPAAVGLGDSWQRGANSPHDFIFWRIREQVR